MYSDISSKVVVVMSSPFQTIKSFNVTVNVKVEFNYCIYAACLRQCSILNSPLYNGHRFYKKRYILSRGVMIHPSRLNDQRSNSIYAK